MNKLSKTESGKLGGIASSEGNTNRRNLRIDQYLLNPKKCFECENPLEYDKKKYKFCSRRCSVIRSNKNSPKRKLIAFNKCKKCNSHTKNEFLCRKCTVNQNFEDGKVSDRKEIKRRLVSSYGYHCFECQLTEWSNNPVPLEVDHIDGNAGNNFPNNLRLLCPNCHALMPTSKGKNKGKGRKSRGLSRY